MIKLKKEVYIYKVVATKNKDCCRSPYSSVDVMVIETNTVKSKCGSMLPYGADEVLEYICQPPIKAKQLITTSRVKNTSLVLCEVEVYAIGKSFKNINLIIIKQYVLIFIRVRLVIWFICAIFNR
jgi:hypothetical protein